jgi:hypothetical protein
MSSLSPKALHPQVQILESILGNPSLPPAQPLNDCQTIEAFVKFSELLSRSEAARSEAQSIADARVGELAALSERAGRAEAEGDAADRVVDRLAIEVVKLRVRAEPAEAEAVLLRAQAAAAESRAVAAESKKALLRAALAEARQPWWQRWLR